MCDPTRTWPEERFTVCLWDPNLRTLDRWSRKRELDQYATGLVPIIVFNSFILSCFSTPSVIFLLTKSCYFGTIWLFLNFCSYKQHCIEYIFILIIFLRWLHLLDKFLEVELLGWRTCLHIYRCYSIVLWGGCPNRAHTNTPARMLPTHNGVEPWD